MKRIISILTVAGIIATAVSVQAQSTKKLKVGAMAGLNLANVKESGTGSSSTNSLTGIVVGGYAQYAVSDAFTVQPELQLGQYGCKYTFLGGTLKFKSSYLSVPILAKYVFGTSGFSLAAGPQLGLLLSAKIEGTDVKSELKSTDFSGVFGAGYELKNGVSFAARYQLGLSNIDKNTSSSSTSKNTAFQLTVGYTFLK